MMIKSLSIEQNIFNNQMSVSPSFQPSNWDANLTQGGQQEKQTNPISATNITGETRKQPLRAAFMYVT